ncbi:MAG: hypothetical protein R2713_13955 [Ilumatobacteraceae bacterium]
MTLLLVQIGCGVVGGAVVPLLAIGALLGTLVGRAWLPGVPFVACVGIGACCVLAAGHGTRERRSRSRCRRSASRRRQPWRRSVW